MIGGTKRMCEEFVLSNGLRVVAEPIENYPSVSVGLWIGAGSMYESAEENGLSHFVEHILFKSTENRTTKQIAVEMDALGGQVNAFTAKECPCYYAKVIAGFLCLAHFAGKAYNYMLGEETWKIMPLLRPFALLLVIMFWGGYCDLVRWPAAQLEGTAYAQIYAKNQEIGQLASERWEQIDILTGRIYTKAAMVDNAMDSWQNEDFLQALISSMSVTDYNELSQKLIAGGSWVFKAFLWGFTLIIEKLGLIFLQFSIVLIIMMQTLFMSILYIIGPLSFGFSVLGVWRSSWSAWTARYLSVTFYSVILFVALSVIYTILGYTLEREIQYLTDLVAKTEDPLKDWDEFYEYAGAMTGQACMFVVCIMAACGATMYVPVCSSWIIETSGTAPAATGVTAGVGIVTMGASSVVRAGGSVIKGMGSTIGGGQS